MARRSREVIQRVGRSGLHGAIVVGDSPRIRPVLDDRSAETGDGGPSEPCLRGRATEAIRSGEQD
jgi:hypothetical protein